MVPKAGLYEGGLLKSLIAGVANQGSPARARSRVSKTERLPL